MKKFIAMILATATFFVGLGSLVEGVGAKFKSDEKALELIRKARQAVGGEEAIANVRSMTIVGQMTKTFEVEGATRTEQGDIETNFELPGRMSRQFKLGKGEAENGAKLIEKRVDVVILANGDEKLKTESTEAAPDGVRKVVILKKDGAKEEILTENKSPIILKKGDATWTGEDGKTVNVDGKKVIVREVRDVSTNGEMPRQNDLFRTTLSLLLTAPEGLDVSYTFAGEGSVDGAACDIVEAQAAGSSVKLYLDKSTNLPRMMTFQAMKPFVIKINKEEAKTSGDVKVFARKKMNAETVEYQVKFSDYRTVGGLQLPFRQTQTVAGKEDETIDVTSYEINSANISEKFKDAPTRVLVRKSKVQ